MLLAWRNLSRDPLRLALSVAGVGVSIMLILLLRGYQDGMYAQVSAYFEETPGALVIAQTGVRNGIGGSSRLPEGTEDAVRRTDGVAGVAPVLFRNAIFELHARKQFAFAIGYEPGVGGGPWRLATGREPRTEWEVVIDRLLAGEHDVRVGDSVNVLGRDLTVVGTAEGTTLWIGTYAFMTRASLEALTRSPGEASFLFVSVEPSTSVEELSHRLAQLPGVNILTKEAIVENQRQVLARIYDPALGLMTAIAFVVGVLVVGLVIYAATVERRREYGVLKAIGGRNGELYRVVSIQALIASTLGALVGVALGYAGAAAMMAVRPQFNIVIEPGVVGAALGSSILMALVAAVIPARAVARVEPFEVFRS